MPNYKVFNDSSLPLNSLNYGTDTVGNIAPLVTNKSGALIVDNSLILTASQGLLYTVNSGVMVLANTYDSLAIKITNPSGSGVYVAIIELLISSYDGSINGKFAWHPSYSGGTTSTLTPVNNNAGISVSSQLSIVMHVGTVSVTGATDIANILMPASALFISESGSYIIPPNTSAGFRGISTTNNVHVAQAVTWAEIPTAIFY